MNKENEKTEADMLPEAPIDDKVFTPRIIHILIAIVAVIILSILIIISLSDNSGHDYSYATKTNSPVVADDLKHIFSSSYDGKSVLVTIKNVENDSGRMYFIYDLKLDFIPVSNASRGTVDFQEGTFDFNLDESLRSQVPLGSGRIVRSPAGKVLLKGDSGIDLMQL